ncbi:glycosyltransferase family 4 protein [Alkalihalobacillus sp. AL-G]|uniref:glycosyltransferase family 4 protein n=1 Tax=Alkalihalobacillus sp. AL-G TaxID=2926399 RepID=UPI00272BBE8E|nr:MraY family glycosyltransferase [Alkalihalobacillus sp. AL-G]WLD92992.1 undecaprenyl/decaprenyl-phosphate alpha-N-acetylglucosaminyl 1-phosphate transferase [Alkalihalobacillus sp. AL-G]
MQISYMLLGLLTIILSLGMSWVITPVVIKFAHKINAVDKPGERRVHSKTMPRIGGLSIIIAFTMSFLVTSVFYDLPISILLGGLVIGLTGFLDDKYGLSPFQKLLGQTLAAIIVIGSGLYINYLSVPFDGTMVGVPIWISIPVTFLWIIGVTNAINLIDGLDGLASGVSAIGAFTIFVMALIMGNEVVIFISLALIGSVVGFLYFNFHPAKIFMGDTGSLFLGFILSNIALMGFKQITTVSLIIPIIILGVPITDTIIAIVRRIVNNKSITDADKSHLHHKLLDYGFSHRQTVIIIYGIASLFGLTAIVFSQTTLLGSTIITVMLMLFIELMVEKFSLISKTYRPILNVIAKLANSNSYNGK